MPAMLQLQYTNKKGASFMSISDTNLSSLNNPNPPKNVKRGDTYYMMNASTLEIEKGVIESSMGNTVVLRTKTGIHTCWISALWQDETQVSKELDMRLHPVREKVLSEIRDIDDLLHFLIKNDFEGDDAADLRSAVSIKSRELLGVDPFDREVA